MYAFISASPFIFAHQLHRPGYEVCIFPAIVVAGVLIGSVGATRLIPRLLIDLSALAVWANLLSVVASFAFLAAVLSGHLTVLLAIAPMFVFGIGAGVAFCRRRAHPGDQRQPRSHRLSLRPLRLLCKWAWAQSARRWWARAAIPRARGGGQSWVSAGVIGQVAFWIALHHRSRTIPGRSWKIWNRSPLRRLRK